MGVRTIANIVCPQLLFVSYKLELVPTIVLGFFWNRRFPWYMFWSYVKWLALWVMNGDGDIDDKHDLVDRLCPHQTRAEVVLASIEQEWMRRHRCAENGYYIVWSIALGQRHTFINHSWYNYAKQPYIHGSGSWWRMLSALSCGSLLGRFGGALYTFLRCMMFCNPVPFLWRLLVSLPMQEPTCHMPHTYHFRMNA